VVEAGQKRIKPRFIQGAMAVPVRILSLVMNAASLSCRQPERPSILATIKTCR
jgi:hypothetical protein